MEAARELSPILGAWLDGEALEEELPYLFTTTVLVKGEESIIKIAGSVVTSINT